MPVPTDLALDEIDQRLIKLLSKDGKITNRVLSQRLGVSEVTVATRLRRLSERGIARVVGILELEAAGFGMAVILIIRVATGQAQKVAEELAAIEELRGVSVIKGDLEIVAQLTVSGPVHLRQVLEHKVGKVKGILDIDHELIVDVIGYRPEWATNLAIGDE